VLSVLTIDWHFGKQRNFLAKSRKSFKQTGSLGKERKGALEEKDKQVISGSLFFPLKKNFLKEKVSESFLSRN